jgi:hypothetical protein
LLSAFWSHGGPRPAPLIVAQVAAVEPSSRLPPVSSVARGAPFGSLRYNSRLSGAVFFERLQPRLRVDSPRHEARGNSKDWPPPPGPTMCRISHLPPAVAARASGLPSDATHRRGVTSWRGRCGPRRSYRAVMDAKKKTSVAANPSTERTACNLPHFSISIRLFEPAPAELMALSSLFIGTMAKNV